MLVEKADDPYTDPLVKSRQLSVIRKLLKVRGTSPLLTLLHCVHHCKESLVGSQDQMAVFHGGEMNGTGAVTVLLTFISVCTPLGK